MRRTTISHFAFLIHAILSTVIKGRPAPRAAPEPTTTHFSIKEDVIMNIYQTFLSTMVAAATICISTSAFADSLAYEDYTEILFP